MHVRPLPTLARRAAIIAVLLGLALLPLTAWRSDAANEPAAQPTARETPPLEEQVQLNVPESLRHSRARIYYVAVSLENICEEPVSGPVWLVVEGTNIEGLTLQSATSDDDAIELLGENETLRPGRRTRSQNVLWESAGALAARDRQGFELDYRLTRDPSSEESQTEAATDRPTREDFERVARIQDRWTPELMSKEGVYGTATGVNADGQPAVLVLVERLGIADNLPKQVDGVPVEVRATGEIVAKFPPPPDRGPGNNNGNGGNGGGSEEPTVDPTSRFNRPVPIGVSTGNEGQCSAGTIACRVTGGGKVYALSNNHVYALSNSADPDSDVLQPGRYDTNCSTGDSDVIGSLAEFVEIKFDGSPNKVDAAIAESSTTDLGNATPSDGYGAPLSDIVAALPGMDVQKYGRSSGQTTGTIVGINATVNVNYGGGNVAMFVDQIVVDGDKGGFIKSGDSGSLLVDSDKSPTGLLYAGSMGGKTAIACSIQNVIDEFKALGVTLSVDGE